MRKILICISVLVGIFLIAFAIIYRIAIARAAKLSGAPQVLLIPIASFIKPPRQYSIIVVGDIMLDRAIPSRVARAGNNDWLFPFALMSERLQNADIVFGNHEGPVSDLGVQDTSKRFSFHFPLESTAGVATAGFDVVAIANNHALDRGYPALCDTANRLRAVGITPIGGGCNKTEAFSPYVKTLPDGTTVAFLAYTEFYKGATATDDRPGLFPYTVPAMTEAIADAKTNGADIVLVSIHWGVEYMDHPTDAQREMAHALIDGGADVIVGHHPHVPQDFEIYNGKTIFYSLGNFVFDQYFSEKTMHGMMGRICVSDGKVISSDHFVVTLTKDYQPYLETDEAARFDLGCM